jgi:hypothetical protein
MAIGLLVWALIIGVALAYQGFAMVHNNDRWPAFSDIIRSTMGNPFGRWVVFGLWLWLGWHLFMRGWHFSLRPS